MQHPRLLTTLLFLFTIERANAQLLGWFCTCSTNGVVAQKIMANCCSSVSGNIEPDACNLVSGTNPSQGPTGTFIQCCFDNGQGAECTQ
ncbi:hypothetical protein R3P38DRAFT_3243503 [Favolaschia claudopus]|uniref:Uncharacterized protein n=1 Tax=Favolaschia claudopus TaxID=2862362 RepID=A0AAV9Z3J3_9AGAR